MRTITPCLVMAVAAAGCAYPSAVKESAARQAELVGEVRVTAGRLEKAVLKELAQQKSLAVEALRARRARDLLERGCAAPTPAAGCDAALADSIVAASRDAGSDLDRTAEAVEAQFSLLDVQLRLMGRAAAVIHQYVGIDVKLDEDQLEALKTTVAGKATE